MCPSPRYPFYGAPDKRQGQLIPHSMYTHSTSVNLHPLGRGPGPGPGRLHWAQPEPGTHAWRWRRERWESLTGSGRGEARSQSTSPARAQQVPAICTLCVPRRHGDSHAPCDEPAARLPARTLVPFTKQNSAEH